MPKKIKTKKEVKDDFKALINSCVEGYNGDWDASGEGREGFMDMHSILLSLAEHFNVDVSKTKEI